MRGSIQNTSIGIIVLGIGWIAIELIPISRQASHWNKCFKTHKQWLESIASLPVKGEQGINAMSVAMCNGAVYEPKFSPKNN
ncbi:MULTISPECIES: hypothetical protein [Prochlorococcus]|uniref:hypothetical protein n=1 Tax=Prochlorococcus TaxID=1218 RepID=UPI000533AF19|nr:MULTISPECIES: hypothetical protein [Prochlorococcus]KGG12701.1 hypothetical protein EV05_1919 [Prochlorococcus sp. MIT 0601]